MIISKVDKARSMYVDAIFTLQTVLRTQRATGDARAELNKARRDSVCTGTCAYCGSQVQLRRSLRHTEACEDCGRKLDRMMMLKSKALAGSDSISVYRSLLDEYSSSDKLPYALRGASGDVQEIVDNLNRVIDAYANYRVEFKASTIREAARSVAAARRKDILDMLVQCGADPNDPATLERVEEIYEARENL